MEAKIQKKSNFLCQYLLSATKLKSSFKYSVRFRRIFLSTARPSWHGDGRQLVQGNGKKMSKEFNLFLRLINSPFKFPGFTNCVALDDGVSVDNIKIQPCEKIISKILSCFCFSVKRRTWLSKFPRNEA